MIKEQELYKISIKQLKNISAVSGDHNDLLITSQIIKNKEILKTPCRIDALVIMVCNDGEARFSINTQEVHITKGTLFINLPENIIRMEELSSDFKGHILIASIDYLKNIHIDLKEVFPFYVVIKNKGYYSLRRSEMKILTKFYDLIQDTMDMPSGTRREDVLRGLIAALIYRICDGLDRLKLENEIPTKSKEYYFYKFTELVADNYRTHREVSFYADSLCLSRKYMSSMIKEITGRTASQWIENYVLMEAKTLLRFSDKSIAEIAYYLNFANPSFFGKYFKKYTGITPGHYRSNPA